VIYRHKDVAHLRELLETARREGRPDGQPYRAILVVTDGVFSMDGDIAPLPGIVEAAEAFDAAVFVDDAHASGVLGRNGRGSVDHFDLHGRVAIQVGTLSKAMGVLGGYVAGPLALREMLIQRGRPFLFSTSHPPAVAAACLAAVRVLEEEPELIERLWANTRRFKEGLRSLGFDTGVSETPITPVLVGDSALAIRFADQLLDEGVWATSVVFPTVALDGARTDDRDCGAHARAARPLPDASPASGAGQAGGGYRGRRPAVAGTRRRQGPARRAPPHGPLAAARPDRRLLRGGRQAGIPSAMPTISTDRGHRPSRSPTSRR
jgi:glycine C-acetyltransferase